MASHRPAPAAPDASTQTTPPAAEAGAGTSPAPAAPDTVAGDGSGHALPPASDELKEFTPVPKPAPGAADFDINAPGVSSADLQEHLAIVRLRRELADLDKPTIEPVTVALVDAPAPALAPAEPNPGDIRMVNSEGVERYFTPTSRKLMGDDTGDFKEAVDKPADI